KSDSDDRCERREAVLSGLKDTLTVVMAAVALLVSLRNAWRDRRVQGLQQPVLKFHVRISEYVDKDLIEKDLPIFRDDRRAAMKKLTEFPIAIYVKATNEGLYPATVEYCGCLVSYPGVRRPQDAPNHSEAVVEEVKCKLGQGDSYEWAIKFRIFPYRILGIFLANSFGRMWLVDNRQVLNLHRKYVRKWPYTDARLSLVWRPISMLFLRWYQ